jgi:hypothetical protein
MSGAPVSHRFSRRARLSARRRRVAATCPRCVAPLAHLKGAVGTARQRLDSRLPTASRVPRSDSVIVDRLATRAAGRRYPLPTACVRARRRRRLHRPYAGECACAAAFLAPPICANPLHPHPRRSPPVAAKPSCHPTPASTPRHVTRRRPLRHESCRAAVHAPVSPRHAFPGRLSCVGEVAAAGQVCHATSRVCCTTARRRARVLRWPSELGQAVGCARCAGRGRAGPGWAAHVLCRPAAPTLCNWVERGFGPVAFDFFYIFRIYSIPCKFKNLCRIHFNTENYETNFFGKTLIGTRF